MTNQLKNDILSKCEDAQIWKVGKWDWVMFKKKPEQTIREAMKAEGGFYNGKRQVWQFSNGYPSKHSKEDNNVIFAKYGVEEQVLSVN